MDDIERLRQTLQSYEEQISTNHALIEELSATVENLQREIKSSLVRVGSSCNAAVKSVESTAESYKTGKPEGYDTLVNTVKSLRNVQDKTLVPFISDLAVKNFSTTAWNAFNHKVDELSSSLEDKIANLQDLRVVDIGIVNSNSKISEKVAPGISLVTMVFDNGVVSRSLSGWWSQRDTVGSGIMTDSEGNAFLLTEEGDSVRIKLLEESKVQETVLLTADQLNFIVQLANSGITVEQLSIALQNLLREETSLKNVALVSVGVVTAEGGATKFLEKTYNGLQFVKVTIGGVTFVGPWIRENTYGQGLLFDEQHNLWKVYFDGIDIKVQQVDGTDLVSNNIVSADIEALLSVIQRTEAAAQEMNRPGSRIAIMEDRMDRLERSNEEFNGTVKKDFATQKSLDTLIEAVGTTEKIEGKNLVQTILSLQHEISLLKDNETTQTTYQDTSIYDFDNRAVSPQHKLFLKIINNMVNLGTRDITGDTLISQGLLAITSKGLSVWKADFVNSALWSESVETFLNSFDINLSDVDTGSILGKNVGSGITYKPDDVILADYSHQLVYPSQDYRFTVAQETDSLDYSMKRTKRDGLQIFVQQPGELSESKRDTIAKIIAWYLPASIDLIDKATGLSFNSATSKLSKIRFAGETTFFTFNEKAIIFVFDDWKEGYNVKTPQEQDLITVNFPVKDSDTKKAAAVVFDINSNYYGATTGNNGIGINGVSVTLDRALCHSLVTAVLATNVSNYDTLPLWFKEGVAALVHGYDDIAVDINGLLTSRTRLEKALSVKDYNDYETWDNKQDPTVAGYLLLRYLLFTVIAQNKISTEPDSLISQSTSLAKRLIQNMISDSATNPTIILDNGINSLKIKWKTVADIKGDFLSTLQKSLQNSEPTSTFLARDCGINLSDNDNGSLQGISAGGTLNVTVDNAVTKDVINEISYPTSKVHFNGQPVYFKQVEDVLFFFPDKDQVTEDQQYTLSLISSCFLSSILQQIKRLTGLSFKKKLNKGILKIDNKVTVYDTPFILLCFDNNEISPYSLTEDLVKTTCRYDYTLQRHNAVVITLNSAVYSEVLKDNYCGKSSQYPDKPCLDITLLQELCKAALAVNLTGERYPLWFLEGFSRLLGGADDELSQSLTTVLQDFTRTEAALNPDVTDTSVFADIKDPATVGYAMLRYLINQTV